MSDLEAKSTIETCPPNFEAQALRFQKNLEKYTSEYAVPTKQDPFLNASKTLCTCAHSNIFIKTFSDLQYSYYLAKCERTENWNNQIQLLTQQQQEEMFAAREMGLSSDSITSRRQQFSTDIETLKKTRDSEIEEMYKVQAAEYKSWVIFVYELYVGGSDVDVGVILIEAFRTLSSSNKKVSKELTSILGIDGNNKESTPKFPHSPINPESITTAQEDENLGNKPKIKELVSMGFDVSLSKCALKMAKNDLQQATFLLLDTPDKVQTTLNQQLSEKHSSLSENASTSRPGTPSSIKSQDSFSRFSRLRFPNENLSVQSSKTQDLKTSPKNNFFNMANSARNWLGKALDSLNVEDVRDSAPNPTNYTDSFVLMLGSHQRTPFSICLTDEDPIVSHDFTSDLLAQNLRNLYKPELTARLVLFHPTYFPNYHLGRLANHWLFSACNRANEIHFPNIKDQLVEARNQVPGSFNVLEEGDFFITKHSNISSTQIIIHMAAETNTCTLPDDLPQRSNLVFGLRSLLATCLKYGVTRLILPIENDKGALSSPAPTSLAQKLAASAAKSSNSSTSSLINSSRRHESLFKCIKGLLIENNRTGALPYPFPSSPLPILGLTFLLPPTDQLQFKHTQNQLQAIFKP